MKYVILAGGSGSRLWPLSRKKFPKQFIPLINDKTMLQNTALRVSREKGQDIFVISDGDSKFIVNDNLKEVLPRFSEDNMIIEPESRNTAPAIVFGTLFFDDSDIIAVLSSDHHIGNDEIFNQTLERAGEIADQDYIVTLGIVPDAPRTGYGYIKKSGQQVGSGHLVEEFVEKPDQERAKQYLDEGCYFWNAGIFVFRVSTFLEELQKHAPQMREVLEQLRQKRTEGQEITLEDYQLFEKISIDYALMEKSKKIVVIPSEFAWSDVGSFKSLYDILDQDENRNILRIEKDNFYNIGSENLLVYGSKRKVAAINLKNLIIVDTPDALLISDNKATEAVKKVVEELKEDNAYEADHHSTVYRPWGSYKVLDKNENYQVKQLKILPGKSISLQYHYHRSENWTVVSGIAEVSRGEKQFILKPSESVYISSTEVHRLANPSNVKELTVIETQTGDYLGEDDIIRIEDDFERV